MDNLIDNPVKLDGAEKNSYADGAGAPSVTLSCPEVLQIPEDALVTFRVKRGPLTVRSASRTAPAFASCTLELVCLCSVEEAESEEAPAAAAEDSAIDRLFAQAQNPPEEEAKE